jgi:hypothetical protein
MAADVPKKKASFLIPEDLLERTRNAVVHLQGPPLFLSMASLITQALEAEVSRLEREHNGGAPFPSKGRVKTGRPVGS